MSGVNFNTGANLYYRTASARKVQNQEQNNIKEAPNSQKAKEIKPKEIVADSEPQDTHLLQQ